MALRGHESLIQLVGRRRRLIGTSHQFSLLDERSSEKDGLVQVLSASGSVSEVVVETRPSPFLEQDVRLSSDSNGEKDNRKDWVQCPICSKSIHGSGINNHLDLCLAGTRKRKCTQVTLSFFATKKGQACGGNTDCTTEEDRPVMLISPTEQTFFEKKESTVSSVTQCADPGSKSPTVMTLLNMKPSSSLEVVVEAHTSNYKERIVTISCQCSCHTGLETYGGAVRPGGPHSQADLNIADTSSANLLSTWIVGRRFRRGVGVAKGLQVLLRREPHNEHDSNAIEVVPLASSGGTALGHVPRELAIHLAPLVDNHNIEIQGSVTAVPEQTNKSVPVSLFLKKPFPKAEDEDQVLEESLLSCWQSAQAVASGGGGQRPASLARQVSKYQQNFLFLLNKVLDQDSHLFSQDEKSFLESFKSLSEDAQRLFLRLYQRKGPWFRISSIVYGDVDDVCPAAEELIVARYFTRADFCSHKQESGAGIGEKLDVLNVSELKQLLISAQLKTRTEATTARREELINWVLGAAHTRQSCTLADKREVTFLSLVVELIGTCICISDLASFLLWRLQRLFFLNGGQELSSFLLVDMGVLRYPSYRCHRTQHVFPNIDTLQSYEKALEVGQAMDMALESNDLQSALNLLNRAEVELQAGIDVSPDRCNTFLGQFSAAWVYATVCTLGVSILERERRYIQAVGLLRLLLSKRCCPGRRGYWTVRLSTDLDHLGRKEESLQVAECGINDPCIRGGDCVSLQRRVIRLGKPPRRWKRPSYADSLERRFREVQIRGRPLNSVTGVKSKFYGFDDQQCGVEELALQFYAGDLGGRWQGVHSEGGIWMTFFGILMWDVLFADVPDVFQTSFQTAPLDLDTESFYTARRTIIEVRLSVISKGDVAGLLAEAWNAHYGIICRGVNWDRHTLTELQTIAECIGGPGISAICRLLAEDHKGLSGGMPDLLLWRKPPGTDVYSKAQNCPDCRCKSAGAPSGRGQGEAKLVEVKGPRDRLSEQQRAWILILTNAGLSVEVCKVLENLDEDVKVVH